MSLLRVFIRSAPWSDSFEELAFKIMQKSDASLLSWLCGRCAVKLRKRLLLQQQQQPPHTVPHRPRCSYTPTKGMAGGMVHVFNRCDDMPVLQWMTEWIWGLAQRVRARTQKALPRRAAKYTQTHMNTHARTPPQSPPRHHHHLRPYTAVNAPHLVWLFVDVAGLGKRVLRHNMYGYAH